MLWIDRDDQCGEANVIYVFDGRGSSSQALHSNLDSAQRDSQPSSSQASSVLFSTNTQVGRQCSCPSGASNVARTLPLLLTSKQVRFVLV